MKKRSLITAFAAIILLCILSFTLIACNNEITMNKLLKFDMESISEISIGKENISKVTDNKDKINTINAKLLDLKLKKYDKKTYDSDWDTTPAYRVTYKQNDKEGYFEILIIIRDIHDLDKGVVNGSETLIGLRKVGDFDKKSSKEGFYTPIDNKFEETVFELFLNVM